MRLKTLALYTGLSAGILMSSCNSFLDEMPKGVVIPSKLQDYQALMSNPIKVTRTSNNIFFATDEIQLPEAMRSTAIGYSGRSAVNAYDFQKEHYDISENDEDWNYAYSALYIFNTVIEGIKVNTEDNPSLSNQLMGEALVHRAYTNLILVNQYAEHYGSSSSPELGIPLPLKPDIDALLKRSSIQEVYQQIESDLLAAIDLLPEKSSYTYRPNKAAAYGTLSRMYLYQSQWNKSAEYASKALALNNFLYDYNDFKHSIPNNHAASQVTGYPSSSIDKRHVIFLKYFIKVGAFNYNFVLSDDLAAQFEPGDLRMVFGTTDKDYYGKALPGLGVLENKPVYDYNNGGISTQELLLNRAEANARLKNSAAAMEDLNVLREKRFAKDQFVALSANSPTDALDKVLKERRIELAFTGLRLADIKRFNLEGRNINFKHGTVEIKANDPRLVFPIAPKVISLNNNLVQNPR